MGVAGAIALLAETTRVARLEREPRMALAPRRRARALHDPAKIVLQLVYALSAGGDCLAEYRDALEASAIVGAVPSDART